MKKTHIISFALLLLFSFVALNIAVFLFGSSQIFDLTADRKYTLQPETLHWLNTNKKDIYIRLYKSSDLKRIDPSLSEYALYVVKLLEQYQIHSHNHLGLQIVNIDPFSIQEAEARNLEIEELISNNTNQTGFLGLVISDDSGHMRTLPFLNPQRQKYLEQDISRILSNLDNSQRTDIGILSPAFKLIPSPDAFDHTSPWPITELLARDYDLTYVSPQTGQIPFNVDVLLVVNPVELSNVALYAIDQFLMYGGKVIMLMDSLSDYMLAHQLMPPKMLSVSYLPEFLKRLGITYIPDTVIGDLNKNRIVQIDNKAINYPFWLQITPDLFSDHTIMTGVSNINMNTASKLIVTPQEGINTQVLFTSSPNGVEVNNAELSHQSLGQELKTLHSTEGEYPLAVLLEGKFNSYFKEPYISAIKEVPFVSLSLDKSSLLVVADSDILLASTWNKSLKEQQEWYHMEPFSGNVDFLLNAIDYLSASKKALNIKPKKTPFLSQSLTNVFALQAQQAYAKDVQKTVEELNKTEARLSQLFQQIGHNELIPSLKLTREIEKLQRKKLKLQKQKQRIEYQTTQKYQEIINRFIIYNLIITVGIIGVMILVVEFMFRRNRRKAEEYINE